MSTADLPPQPPADDELGAPEGEPAAATSLPPDGRARAPWTRVLALGLAAFALWFLLFAPTLQHNAQVSPVGKRRTVSLDIVGPVAALTRTLQLSRIVSATGRENGQIGGTGLTFSGPTPDRSGTRPNSGHHPATVAGPTTTTTTAPDPKDPTAADPLRVLIIGDSIGLDLGDALQPDLATTGVVNAALDGRESTGLTRPDYFNWPAELQNDLKTVNPQVVVIMMGANDAQDFPGPPDVPYTSPEWNTLYAQRAAQFMQIAESGGAAVVWVGMPPMQNPALSAQMADINAVDSHEAAVATPPVHFVSTTKSLGTPQGGYTAFETNSAGQIVNTRTPDGIHLTPGGGQLVAQQVIAELQSLGYHIP
jgi:uncharacterized protein